MVNVNYCPFCGRKVTVGAKYCNICGKKLPVPVNQYPGYQPPQFTYQQPYQNPNPVPISIPNPAYVQSPTAPIAVHNKKQSLVIIHLVVLILGLTALNLLLVNQSVGINNLVEYFKWLGEGRPFVLKEFLTFISNIFAFNYYAAGVLVAFIIVGEIADARQNKLKKKKLLKLSPLRFLLKLLIILVSIPLTIIFIHTAVLYFTNFSIFGFFISLL